MPNEVGVDDAGLFIPPGPHPQTGWVTNMASVTDTQIAEGYTASIGTPALQAVMEECIRALAAACGWQCRLSQRL